MLFYTQLFASKGAPLAKVWLAAHWERKISKDNVHECNLESTIEDIISPQASIGLRTSSHLLVGVVRIYSKKAKYLLADCSDALVKIKVAFRPGQVDRPVEGLEAMTWTDFTDLDADLCVDAVDHSLNQSGKEKITLKEDFGNRILVTLQGGQVLGDESHQPQELLDITCQSLAQCLADPGDSFGDEGNGMSVLEWMTSSSDYAFPEVGNTVEDQRLNKLLENLINQDPMEVDTPVDDTTATGRKTKERRVTKKRKEQRLTVNKVWRQMAADYCNLSKRKPFVDQSRELEDDDYYQLINDYSDLIEPPLSKRAKLIETKRAAEQRRRYSVKVIHQGLQQLFPRNIEELIERGRDDSTSVHPSGRNTKAQSSLIPARSALESQDQLEERRLARKTQKLLNTLRSRGGSRHNDATFSFKSLCKQSSRTQASETFYHLLALKKQQAVILHQNSPYEDILVAPGSQFHTS